MTFFLSSTSQDYDCGVGLTEPSAWISEATHQTVFTEWLFFDFATAKSEVFRGGGLKILFLINFLHLASVAAALQSFR
jgi:hypothetical protein